MYCIECGKGNPDEAKFCAFCGTRLLSATPGGEGADALSAAAPMPEGERPGAGKPVEAAPEAPRQTQIPIPPANPREGADAAPELRAAKPDPHQQFRRPADGPNVRPLMDNPAQPVKAHATPAAARPALDDPFDAEPVREQPPQPEVPPKPKAPRTPPRLPDTKAVTSSGGQVPLPSRVPNVKRPKRYGATGALPPSASPFQEARQRLRIGVDRDRDKKDDDLFFEDIDASDNLDYGDDRLAKVLKWTIGVLFLVLVVSAIGWLFFTSGGQIFLAGLGMDASADAYAAVGDRASEKGELKRAAEAYHQALWREPDNYHYALKAGKAYQRIADYDRAQIAYNKCMELNEKQPEPYRLLAELLEQQGGAQAGEQVRQLGYEKTGDASLLVKGGS